MPRLPSTPITALGQALRARRGGASGQVAAAQIGIPWSVYYRLEAGRRTPAAQTARRLARWLGWPMERVYDELEQPAVVEQAAAAERQPAVEQVAAPAALASAPAAAPLLLSPALEGADDEQPTPAGEAVARPCRSSALSLPNGKVLRPWAQHPPGGGMWQRLGAGDLKVLATQQLGRVTLAGMGVELGDGDGWEEHADQVDQHLLSLGATIRGFG